MIEAESIGGMEVLNVTEASGGKAARLPASIPPWGWVTIGLGRELPAGSYKVSFRLFGGEGAVANSNLYWTDEKEHLPGNGLPLPMFSDQAAHEGDVQFVSTAPFRNLILKKRDGAATPGLTIDWLKIEAAPPRNFLAYRHALSMPLIGGIDKAPIRKALEAAKIADVERWLELVAGLTDAEQQVCYLEHLLASPVIRNKAAHPEIRALRASCLKARGFLNSVALEGASQELSSLEANLKETIGDLDGEIGGSIMPDRQNDPFTWLNAPILQGFLAEGIATNVNADTARTFGQALVSEPTPFYCAWLGGPALQLAEKNASFSVDHSWTGAEWNGPFKMSVSVFSPAVRISGLDTFSVDGGTSVDTVFPNAIVVNGKSWRLLVSATEGKRVKASVANGKATVRLPRNETVWILPIREASLASAWIKLLPNLPQDAVQIRKGNVVTQYFSGGKKTVAPIPPMLQFAMGMPGDSPFRPTPLWNGNPKILDGQWGKPLCSDEFSLQLPTAYLERGILAYKLQTPSHPLAGCRGINAWAKYLGKDDIELLAKEGVNYIRLVITEPPEKGFEAWFEPLKPILENCRKNGIKVNFDPHFLSVNDFDFRVNGTALSAKDGGSQEFIAFWRQIAVACKGYRDVICVFDLKNEPGQNNSFTSWAWFDIVEKAIVEIRKIDPETPLLVESTRGANPTGFPFLRQIKAEHIIYGFHLYYPHGFTHQAVNSREAAPLTAYPSWVPIINWRDDGWSEPAEWWDRWTLRGACLPVYRWWIEHGYPPLDNGEFGVVGYAQARTPGSMGRWTRDAILLNETVQASWAFYGFHGGFGWYDGAKPSVREFWKLNKKTLAK